ncbi:MAG TPA: DUF5313 family protein [Pseudonocardia sp.]|nr:DUF5313 family protein [Pseudonocardia sp.]
MELGARRRPGPVRWLLYAFGRGLPPEHREWVLHDLTTRTWALRQLLRSTVQVLPFALVLAAVLPGEPWVRVMAVAGGWAVGMIYAVAYLYETTEHRAIKAGYPRGLVQEVRGAAGADQRAAEERRYAERYRRPEDPPSR